MPVDNSANSRPTPDPARARPELTADEFSSLRSNVPPSTHVLLVGIMVLFFSVATLITLQANWLWWVIPAAVAVPVVTVLSQRWSKVSKLRTERLARDAELRRAARPGSGR